MQKGSLKKSILIFVIVMTTVLAIGLVFLNHYVNQLSMTRIELEEPILGKHDDDDENEIETPENIETELTILIMGTDQSGYRTDSMLAANIDFKTKTVSLFSIPRDYRIKLNTKVQDLINHHTDYLKMTELHSYAKSADYVSPASLTASAAEELLGFRFDHIVLINFKAFREVIDALGGIEVNVPTRLYYNDPYQDLHIDLQAGMQTLNGRQAEGLVRFRQDNNGGGYGDFNRMEVQQYVLKEFVKKVVSLDSALNANELFEIAKENVQTDANLKDLIYLLSRANEIDFNRIYSHTLEGYGDTIGGVYYYVPPKTTEIRAFVNQAISTDRTPTLSSKEYDIIIHNGSGKGKRAAKTKEILTENGYNVVEIGDSPLEPTMKTRIFVPKDGLGKDLQEYFNLSEILIDPEEENIKIVLGMLTE